MAAETQRPLPVPAWEKTEEIATMDPLKFRQLHRKLYSARQRLEHVEGTLDVHKTVKSVEVLRLREENMRITRLRNQEEAQLQLRRENHRLVERLCSVMRESAVRQKQVAAPRPAAPGGAPASQGTLNTAFRRKVARQIDQENYAMLDRLLQAGPRVETRRQLECRYQAHKDNVCRARRVRRRGVDVKSMPPPPRAPTKDGHIPIWKRTRALPPLGVKSASVSGNATPRSDVDGVGLAGSKSDPGGASQKSLGLATYPYIPRRPSGKAPGAARPGRPSPKPTAGRPRNQDAPNANDKPQAARAGPPSPAEGERKGPLEAKALAVAAPRVAEPEGTAAPSNAERGVSSDEEAVDDRREDSERQSFDEQEMLEEQEYEEDDDAVGEDEADDDEYEYGEEGYDDEFENTSVHDGDDAADTSQVPSPAFEAGAAPAADQPAAQEVAADSDFEPANASAQDLAEDVDAVPTHTKGSVSATSLPAELPPPAEPPPADNAVEAGSLTPPAEPQRSETSMEAEAAALPSEPAPADGPMDGGLPFPAGEPQAAHLHADAGSRSPAEPGLVDAPIEASAQLQPQPVPSADTPGEAKPEKTVEPSLAAHHGGGNSAGTLSGGTPTKSNGSSEGSLVGASAGAAAAAVGDDVSREATLVEEEEARLSNAGAGGRSRSATEDEVKPLDAGENGPAATEEAAAKAEEERLDAAAHQEAAMAAEWLENSLTQEQAMSAPTNDMQEEADSEPSQAPAVSSGAAPLGVPSSHHHSAEAAPPPPTVPPADEGETDGGTSGDFEDLSAADAAEEGSHVAANAQQASASNSPSPSARSSGAADEEQRYEEDGQEAPTAAAGVRSSAVAQSTSDAAQSDASAGDEDYEDENEDFDAESGGESKPASVDEDQRGSAGGHGAAADPVKDSPAAAEAQVDTQGSLASDEYGDEDYEDDVYPSQSVKEEASDDYEDEEYDDDAEASRDGNDDEDSLADDTFESESEVVSRAASKERDLSQKHRGRDSSKTSSAPRGTSSKASSLPKEATAQDSYQQDSEWEEGSQSGGESYGDGADDDFEDESEDLNVRSDESKVFSD